MQKNITEQPICSKKLTSSDLALFQNLIDNKFNHNWVFGEVRADPFKLGNRDNHGYYRIYDHFNINFYYFKSFSKNDPNGPPSFRIRKVIVIPSSKKYLSKEESQYRLPLFDPTQLEFSYDVQWIRIEGERIRRFWSICLDCFPHN
jgi:hypothetical protein